MSDFEVKILNATREAVKAAWDIEPEEGLLVVETPKDPTLGDYATSVALKLSRTLRKNPMEIAAPIVEKLAAGGGEHHRGKARLHQLPPEGRRADRPHQPGH